MTEKVLQEFSSKILKAKNLYEQTKGQCDMLKREATKLEKEYEGVLKQKEDAENIEKQLKNQYESSKKNNEIQSEHCQKEMEDLNSLRNLKKKLKREKDICESDLMKNSLALEELVKERINLQVVAKQYSEKLESIIAERQALNDEYEKTNRAIVDYSGKIKELKDEMDTMKDLISQSFQRVIPYNNVSNQNGVQYQHSPQQ